MRPELRRYLYYGIAMLVLSALQVTFVPLIGLSGVQPSLPLIGIVFISLLEGATPSMLFGFSSGLLIDLYAGELVGITSLSLTITAFVLSFFHDEEKRLLLIRSPRAVAIVFLGALINSLIFLFTYFQTLDFHVGRILLRHVGGASIYTTVLSMIPVLILARTGSRLKV